MSNLPITTAAATQPIRTTTATAAPNAVMGADFNMFLKLLTTQMQNQDPLSPMDSTQYTQQLAQYSQVEQTVQQTGTLKDILARLSTQDMSQAAGFIGRDAVFNSAVAGLGDAPASWSYSAPRGIASATATITDASGATVFTRALDPSGTTGTLSWDGTKADGSTAPRGAYTLAIRAVDADGVPVAPAITSTGMVSDVSLSNGAVSLGVNGATMALDKLVRLAAAR